MVAYALRRALSAVAVAGAVISASQIPAAAVGAATPTMTIDAQGYYRIGNLTWARYHSKVGWAHISGRWAGAAAGDVVRLYAKPWPFNKPFVQLLRPRTLPRSRGIYGFPNVTPKFATRYKVELFASKSSTKPLAVTSVATVYVVENLGLKESASCPRPDCTSVVHVNAYLPPSAMRTERPKKIYTYFAVRLSPGGIPPAPKYLYLGAGHPRLTRTRKVAADQYRFTVRFTFRIGNNGAHWGFNLCNKDTEKTDGLGLPGHHHCGDKRIPNFIPYLG